MRPHLKPLPSPPLPSLLHPDTRRSLLARYVEGKRARKPSLMRKVHQRAGGRHSGVHQGHVDVSSGVQECFQEVGDLVPGFIQASDLSVQGGRQTLITAAINADENIVLSYYLWTENTTRRLRYGGEEQLPGWAAEPPFKT